MQLLEERIRKDGIIKEGNVLKVDRFLNHQMDIHLFEEIGKEFYRRFSDAGVNKILTIEASGIGIACITAQYFDVPVVFAKKNQTKNIAGVVVVGEAECVVAGAELVEDGVKLPEEGGLGVREGAQREAGIFLEADHLLGPGCGSVCQDVGVDEEVRGVMRWLFHERSPPLSAAVRDAARPTARIR